MAQKYNPAIASITYSIFTMVPLLLLLLSPESSSAFVVPTPMRAASPRIVSTTMAATTDQDSFDCNPSAIFERRSFLTSIIKSTTVAAATTPFLLPRAATASDDTTTTTTTKSTSDAVITSKIFIELKGIPPPPPPPEEESTSSPNDTTTYKPSTDRIVIGLFGNDAPQPVSILTQLVSPDGLPTKCKPLESRTLQREQLEANKVYNSCMETQDSKGVTYDLSSVWRVDKNKRIDVGAVSGKFVARENPTFESSSSSSVELKHDAPGVVSVRKGNDGGFGFTIYPGNGGKDASELNEDNIVVGKVLEGMDVVMRLNNVPVVQSSSVNYMGLTGGQKGKNAPSRACRYGGPMYCNELKPLKKILIEKTGVL